MKDPKDPDRLRHSSSSSLERALLGVGSSAASSSETRAKTMAALGLAGSATLLAGAATASSLGSVAKLGWAKLIVSVSLVGAATAIPVSYYVAKHQQESADRARAAQTARTVAAPSSEPRAVVPVAAPAPIVVAPARPARVAPVERPAASPRGALARELGLLDAARAALSGGDARGALSLLDGYSQSYPHGRLELEAEVLRIDALARAGRSEAARQRAEAFLRQHPQSVLAARVRAQAGIRAGD